MINQSSIIRRAKSKGKTPYDFTKGKLINAGNIFREKKNKRPANVSLSGLYVY